MDAVFHGTEQLYVVNRISREIHHYFVIKESEPGYTLAEATETDPVAGDMQEINQALDAYDWLQSNLEVSYHEIKSYLGAGYWGPDFNSALDYVVQAPRRNALIQAAEAWMSDGIMRILGTIILGVGDVVLGNLNSVTVLIEMPDGSYIILDLEHISLDQPNVAGLKYRVSFDSQGNVIPTGGSFGGIFVEGGRGLIREYSNAAQRLNYLIRYYNSCNRITVTFTCSNATGRCTVTASPACP